MILNKDNFACDNCNCVIKDPINIQGDNYCNNGECHSGGTCPECNSSGGFINSDEGHKGMENFKTNKQA